MDTSRKRPVDMKANGKFVLITGAAMHNCSNPTMYRVKANGMRRIAIRVKRAKKKPGKQIQYLPLIVGGEKYR
jgi:hypothetical protein